MAKAGMTFLACYFRLQNCLFLVCSNFT